MKTSLLPSIRVEPDLRTQLERVLQEGETLSAFVEASVRDAVRKRTDQAAFVARGLASIEKAKRTGRSHRAEDVVAELEARLNRARAGTPRKRRAVK